MARNHVAISVLLGFVLAFRFGTSPASADETGTANDDQNFVQVVVEEAIQGNQSDGTQQAGGSSVSGADSCAEFVDGICPHEVCVPDEVSPLGGRLWMVAGGGFMDEIGWCRPAEEVEALPVVTAGMVVRVLRRVPLPASAVSIQPPGGVAPVNFEVIFSTRAGRLEPTVTLLGHQVRLVVTPASFRWVHGDGTEQVTEWAGRAYAKGLAAGSYITHPYLSAGLVGVRVDTTYTATFSVDGGVAQVVPGTVTVEGVPVGLEIQEAGANLNGRY